MSWRKFIVINVHMRSKKRSKINTLSSKLKELEEQDKNNSKASRRQDQSRTEGDRDTKNPSETINPGAGFLKRSTK